MALGGTVALDAQSNPYTDKGGHYELPIISDIPQGERVEIHKDKAQMDLIGWNDEYKISIIPQIPTAQLGGVDRPFTAQANRPLLSKRMEYQSGNVKAFIEPKEGTQNEFDIDFTLHSKPDTNVFEYKIEGAESFDFFFQPPLTAEEIAEGASRPENVVGSYAVYHSFKANHRIGSTNYATGKAFHIYRPKAIDANGVEVWAELSYIEGLLTVTVPPKFLDDAVYPVRVDPTFGYTTAGASGSTFCEDGGDVSTRKGYADALGPIEDATLDSLHFYGYTIGAGTVTTSIFLNRENTSSDSHTQVATIENAESYGTSASLHTFTANSQPFSTIPHVLSVACNGAEVSASEVAAVLSKDNTNNVNTYFEQATYGTTLKENPWTEDEFANDDKYSIYATYSKISRTISTSNYDFCRTMTMTAGGESGGVATTTTLKYPLVATSTITDLIATSTGGDVMSLDADRLTPLDVIFTSDATCYAGSTTALPHYFEKYSSTTGAFTAWIEAPDISSTSAKTISMYYGYATTTDLNSPGQTFATTTVLYPLDVWDLSFPNTATTTYPDFLDATYNTNHGSSLNASSSSLVTGYLDGSIYLDGTNDYVNTVHITALESGDMTFSQWIKPNTTSGFHWITQQWSTSAPGKGPAFYQNGTGLGFQIGAGGANAVTASSVLTANQWTHVVATAASTTLTIFANGVQVGQGTVTRTEESGAISFAIGGPSKGGVSYFGGSIDDVRIYRYALSAMDIRTIYNNTKSSTIFWTFGDETTQGGGGSPAPTNPVEAFINGLINVFGQLLIQ